MAEAVEAEGDDLQASIHDDAVPSSPVADEAEGPFQPCPPIGIQQSWKYILDRIPTGYKECF